MKLNRAPQKSDYNSFAKNALISDNRLANRNLALPPKTKPLGLYIVFVNH